MINAQNPFFEKYNTPHQTVPFDKIKNEHYEPAMLEGIKLHEAEIEAIINNPEAPTFANTIVAYEKSGKFLIESLRYLEIFVALKRMMICKRLLKK